MLFEYGNKCSVRCTHASTGKTDNCFIRLLDFIWIIRLSNNSIFPLANNSWHFTTVIWSKYWFYLQMATHVLTAVFIIFTITYATSKPSVPTNAEGEPDIGEWGVYFLSLSIGDNMPIINQFDENSFYFIVEVFLHNCWYFGQKCLTADLKSLYL